MVGIKKITIITPECAIITYATVHTNEAEKNSDSSHFEFGETESFLGINFASNRE